MASHDGKVDLINFMNSLAAFMMIITEFGLPEVMLVNRTDKTDSKHFHFLQALVDWNAEAVFYDENVQSDGSNLLHLINVFPTNPHRSLTQSSVGVLTVLVCILCV